MATPLEILGAQPQRRGVVVYSPGRPVPSQQRRAMPQRVALPAPRNREQRRAAGERGPGVDWAGFSERVTSTPAAQKAREKQAQEEAEDAAYDDQPWYKKGLGMVLGNPLTKAAMVPLNVIGMGGKLVTAATAEVAEGIDEYGPDWLKKAVDMGGGFVGMVDPERTSADTRSVWEKLSPNSDYGYGQTLDEDNPAWFNRVAGFAGDVALDPTTYLSLGASRVANVAGRSAQLARIAEASPKIEHLMAGAGELAKVGKMDDAVRLMSEAERLRAVVDDAGRLLKELPAQRVPLHQGRKARESFIGELTEQNPDLVARYEKQLASGTERGFSTIRDKALREAIGLDDPYVRFMGQNIPGTGRLATRGAAIGGGARALINKSPVGALGQKFAPRGLEEASATLSRGKGGDVLRAGTAVRIQNLMRRGAGNFEARGNRQLMDLTKQLKKLGGENEIRTLFRQAETLPDRNIFNQFFGDKLPNLYKSITGRDMLVGDGSNTYVPHMMAPEWKRFLHDLDDEKVIKALGFQKDDLLEGSSHLEKARTLKPDVVGTPKEFDIGGRKITLTDGTIDELNEELGRAFPEFKGKAYMDDPVKIAESYINSVARQAGRDLAMQRMADSANPLVREVTGELLEAVETRNKFLRTNPVMDVVRKGYTKGQALVPAKPKGDMPTTPFDDIFATTKHVAESKAQRDYALKEGKQFVEAVGADVKAGRSTLAENLKALRKTLQGGLRKTESEAKNQLTIIDTMLGRIDDEIQKIGPLGSDNVDQLVAINAVVDVQIGEVKEQIKKINAKYGRKIPRDQARIEKELQANLRHLEEQARQVKVKYETGPREMRAEAKARKEALDLAYAEPIEKARRELEAAETALSQERNVTPMMKQRVQEANSYLRSLFTTEDDFDQQRATFFAALAEMREKNIPITRRIDGRLTDETTDAAKTIVAEGEAAAATTKPATDMQAALLRQRDKERAAAAAAEVPPPPGPLVKRASGIYSTGDGYDAVRVSTGWQLVRNETEDLGIHKNLKAANKAIDDEREIIASHLKHAADAAAAREAAAGGAVRTATPEQYSNARDILADELVDIVDEDNLDQIDAIYTLSDQDTAVLVNQMWDSLPESGQQRLREAGVTPPEQAALPAGEITPSPAAAPPAAAPEVPPEAMAPTKAPPGGWKDGEGKKITAPRKPIPTYTDGRFALHADPHPRYSGWGIRQYRLNPIPGQPSFHWMQGKQFATAEEATNEIEEMVARVGGWKVGEEPRVTRATAVPEVAPSPAAAPPAAAPEAAAPKARRKRYRWTKKDFRGGEGFAGPGGWTIEPYQGVGRGAIHGATTPDDPRLTRYIAIRPQTDEVRKANAAVEAAERAEKKARETGTRQELKVAQSAKAKAIDAQAAANEAATAGERALRSQSFATAKEAREAVEDALTAASKREPETSVGYAARAKPPEPQVTATYENLAGTLPPVQPPLPEVAAAVKARLAAVKNLERPAPYAPVHGPFEVPTEEGQELLDLEPIAGPRNVGGMPGAPRERPLVERRTKAQAEKLGQEYTPTPYIESMKPTSEFYRDYKAWKDMEARSIDMSLPEAERSKAVRVARTMGAPFTQKQGKYYEQSAAWSVVLADLEWERARTLDPAVQAAQKKYDDAVTSADRQVEAMVYVSEHNPETGAETLRRLPQGSTEGFGEGTRNPALPLPPRQGEVPAGTRSAKPREWKSTYTEERRAADRALLDSAVSDYMPPEAADEFEFLSYQGELLSKRLDAAAVNESRLNQLDEAAKQAYTTEVKAADEAVLDAKRAQAKARENMKGAIPGAGQAYEDSKQAVRAALDAQTEARMAWKAADEAWKEALSERQVYRDALGKVSRHEREMYSEFIGEGSEPWLRAAREGGPPPVTAWDKKGNPRPPDPEHVKLLRNLQQAYRDVNQMDDAGMSFLEEAERRDLVGQLNAIDTSKRDIINNTPQIEGEVFPSHQILEPPTYAESPSANITKAEGPVQIPPMKGTEHGDLAARAYAESFQPVEPSDVERIVTGTRSMEPPKPAVPGAARSSKLFTADIVGEAPDVGKRSATEFYAAGQTNVRPYAPRTEREAISELERQAADAQAFAASEAGQELQKENTWIALEVDNKKATAVTDKIKADVLGRTERDQNLLPLQNRAETLVSVNQALHDKQKIIPLRNQAKADREALNNVRLGQKADFEQAAADIGAIARQNPDLLDDDMAVTEALLHDTAETAKELIENDVTRQQVQNVIDKTSQKGDHTLDIMLTTVGKNWKMLYEANGTKKPILQAEDIIVQADLHKMFQNLYELKKDPVWFGRTLNAFTNLFKTYATLTPGFHIRNALSAIFMNATDGVPILTQFHAAGFWRDYAKAADSEDFLKTLRAGPGKYGFTGPQIADAFEVAFGTGAGGRFTEAGFAEVSESGRFLDKMNKLQRNKLTRLSQRSGQRVEGSVRLSMALDSMKGGDNIESAIQRVNRIHFDYGEISKLDDNMKRLVPFWTFMSRNMPMQVSQMWTHPRVYLQYEDFVRNFSSKNEEYTPEYWTKAGAWNTGLKIPSAIPESMGGGLPLYLSPDLGYNRLKSDLQDYEDFLSFRRPGAVLSQGNPLFTAPAELAFRKDIFTGQSFEEGETVPVGGPLGAPYRGIAKLLGKEEGGEVDAALMNFFRAINPTADRSVRLTPQLTGGDPEAKKRQLESIGRTMFGLPVRTLTPKQQENEAMRRYYDQADAARFERQRLQRQAG